MRVVFSLNKKGLFWNKNPTDDITWLSEDLRWKAHDKSTVSFRLSEMFLFISLFHIHMTIFLT